MFVCLLSFRVHAFNSHDCQCSKAHDVTSRCRGPLLCPSSDYQGNCPELDYLDCFTTVIFAGGFQRWVLERGDGFFVMALSKQPKCIQCWGYFNSCTSLAFILDCFCIMYSFVTPALCGFIAHSFSFILFIIFVHTFW